MEIYVQSRLEGAVEIICSIGLWYRAIAGKSSEVICWNAFDSMWGKVINPDVVQETKRCPDYMRALAAHIAFTIIALFMHPLRPRGGA